MDRKQNHCKNPALLNTFSSRRDVSTMKIRNFAPIHANFHFWANEKCDSIHVMLNGRKNLIRSRWWWIAETIFWKTCKLPRRERNFHMFTMKDTWRHRRTSGPSRIYIHKNIQQHTKTYKYYYGSVAAIWNNLVQETSLTFHCSPSGTRVAEWGQVVEKPRKRLLGTPRN